MANRNAKIVKDSLTRVHKITQEKIDDAICILADKLHGQMVAYMKGNWQGFTGNAQRSLTVAVFADGVNIYFRNGTNVWSASEIRGKVRKGELVYLSTPYEGKARTVRGAVEVDDYYGFQTAQRLVEQQPRLQKGWTLIACVGVEYFEFIPHIDATFQEYINYYLTHNGLLNAFIGRIKFSVHGAI